ncbi:MAG TPA: 50S ribosomal protein L20 [Tepidisphaeraceae bacterium]|nr:50S ribosomal protein L20 [Tepidisphaeraceae bacterium]
MPRVKGGPSHARKRKRILRRASGFVGQPGKNYRSALEFTRKADVYAYEHRRQKKRFFRQLWITRLGAAQVSLLRRRPARTQMRRQGVVMLELSCARDPQPLGRSLVGLELVSHPIPRQNRNPPSRRAGY